ncbi:hypothetical protein DTO212C5_6762 [Paecilomyces variotii]|nr:hypothetical protein DTO212C5_6762 [Paecilomyces variotii]
MSETTYDLHTYFRSSCSARLRIALNLKSIPYNSIPVNLLKGQQSSESHRALNPLGLVPVLVIHKDKTSFFAIPQSISALEYLEETHPTPSLLPPASHPQARATVRTLVNIIACDVQPVTNLRIQQRVRALGGDGAVWSKELVEAGFSAYEAIAAKSAGKFSVGDRITMADVCLVPACWAAERVNVDVASYATIKRVLDAMEKEEAVQKAHWRKQGDTPEEFRV